VKFLSVKILEVMQLCEQEETSSRYEPAYCNCKTQAKKRAWGTLRVIFIVEHP
jgi:hypothetical protein